MKKYPVITICGNAEKREIRYKQEELTLTGNIVLLPTEMEFSEYYHANSLNEREVRRMIISMQRRKIELSDEIFVMNQNHEIEDNLWPEICYARMLGKKIHALHRLHGRQVEEMVQKLTDKAEELAWQQLDHIRHSSGYYSIDDYVYLIHKDREIVDPWINVETHYNGTPWPDHKAKDQGVDPFKYYGKKKTAAFIEELISREVDRG